ncbi:DUF899 domain-containing protein [Pseudorhodoferax aquiterrae]|nr:thioredoxin family protein [Pseudorhodoferax aquiterrae]
MALLAREKELMRLSDELARGRRFLPRHHIDKLYCFEGLDGTCTLSQLFGESSQLIVQHFMLGPGWEEGCPSCSFMADHVDAMLPHLLARDVAFCAVSRAPLQELERFRQRMGWRFRWLSSYGSDFNSDFGVSFTKEQLANGSVLYNFREEAFPHGEAPGISVFERGALGQVFHTYSTYGRGVEVMMGTYRLLDLTPHGRDEGELPHTMSWVRHHDRYAVKPSRARDCCRVTRSEVEDDR